MDENFIIYHYVEWKMEKSFFETGAESPVFVLYGIRWKLKLQKIVPERNYNEDEFFEVRLIIIDFPYENLDAKFLVSRRWRKGTTKRTSESCISVCVSDLMSGANASNIILDFTRSSLVNRLYKDDCKNSDLLFPDFLYFICSIRPNDDNHFSLQLHKEQFPTISLSCTHKLAQDFKKALSNSEHADIILKCGDKSIPAHKAILSCRSEVFQAMFRNDLKESQEGVVEIDNVDPRVLEKIVHYIYTGNLKVETIEIVCDIYKAAHQYCIDALKERCIHFIKGNLETRHACEVLIMAHLYQDQELKMFVMVYIIFRREFLLSEEWLTFSKDHPTLAQEVFMLFVQKASVI